MTRPLARKTLLLRETITADALGQPCPPVTRVAALAVFRNPLSGKIEADLSRRWSRSAPRWARRSRRRLRRCCRGPAVSYGKAAIIGVGGDVRPVLASATGETP